MNLFLTSYGLGGHHDLLVEMAGGPCARMAIIGNALDAVPIEAQQSYWRIKPDVLIEMTDLGFDVSLIDLRRFFGRPGDLAKILRPYRAIWALGGNSFLLRRAMRDSGFDEVIADKLANGCLYGGVSAGACVAGGNLRPVAIMDTLDATAPGYVTSDPIMSGLGLLPFTIIPHYDCDSADAENAAKGVAFAQKNGIAHVGLRDGEVIVRRDGQIETLAAKTT